MPSFIYNFIVLLYVYDNIIKNGEVKKKRYSDLYEMFSNRFARNKYIGKGYKLGVSKTDFVKAFSKHIVFVAGYMNGYSSKSKTNYGKFLDVETYKNIFDMGYDYCSVDISKL